MVVCDYSHHNGILNWQKAVDAGVIGAYLKASQGTTLLDKYYPVNSQSCPLFWKGAYHFFDYWTGHYQVGDEKGFGIRQADYFIKAIGTWNTTLPACVDIENNKASGWEDLNTVIPRALLILRGFVDRFKEVKGYYPVIYCSSYFTKYLKDFTACPLWVAHYDVEKPVYYNWTEHVLWQYSSKGDGLKYGNGAGNDFVDLNKLGKPLTDWMAMRLPIAPLSQRDRRWADVKLGTSTSTIGGYGCLITDATMMANFLLGKNITPADLNAWLIANGGYHDFNLFVWGIMNKLDTRLSFGYRYNYAALDKIDEQLAKGMPVVINVDLNPATSYLDEHWVLVIGKENGSYIINDPWYGLTMPFEKNYGDPRTGVKIVCTYNFEEQEDEMPLFRVRVRDGITKLVVRSAPVVSSNTVLNGYASGEYDVFEEKNGYGRIGVNRWISMNPAYVQKLITGEPADAEKLALVWAWYKETH